MLSTNTALIILLVSVIAVIIPFAFWVTKVVSLSKREDKTGMWVVLACGFFLSPLVGLLIGWLAYKEEKEEYFWCGICDIRYKKEELGGETVIEGKVCSSCLEKRKREQTSAHSEPQRNKCANCGKIEQEGESFWLATGNETNKKIGYYCEPCKDKHEAK